MKSLSRYTRLVLAAATVVLAACAEPSAADAQAEQLAREAAEAGTFRTPSDAELRRALTPMQYRVTQQDGTEPAFRNEFWDHKEAGLYVDVVSGEPLFSSLDKYESGTGWPSFTRPVVAANVVARTDHKLGYPRTEVRSLQADSHLGHVFRDGPEPMGVRYCINSAALRFIPVARLEAEGYGKFLPRFEKAGLYSR